MDLDDINSISVNTFSETLTIHYGDKECPESILCSVDIDDSIEGEFCFSNITPLVCDACGDSLSEDNVWLNGDNNLCGGCGHMLEKAAND